MAETTNDGISSLPPTRPSILRSKSTSDISTASTASNDSKSSGITFAPLPEITPRKRRSTRPIGLANRAEMLRRARRRYEGSLYEDHHGPPPDGEDGDDIQVPDLGKLMKGLWRSVSRGHGKDKNVRTTQLSVSADSKESITSPAAGEEDGEGGVWMEEVAWSAPGPTHPPMPPDSIKREPNYDPMYKGPFSAEFDGNKSGLHIHQPRLGETKGIALR